jgi:DNA-binding transcriptional LysR family regulator
MAILAKEMIFGFQQPNGIALRFRTIQIIAAVVRHRSVSDAATRLGVTRQAVMKAVQAAQDQFEVSILTKVNGRWQPTPEAEHLAKLAEPVLDALRRAHHEAQMAAAGYGGRVRMCAAPSIAHSFVPGALSGRFHARSIERFPLELDVGDVQQSLSDGDCDLALSFGIDDPSGEWVTEPVAQGRLVCVLPVAHHLAARDSIAAADLRGGPLIGYDARCAPEADTNRLALAGAGLIDAVTVTVQHGDLACHLARRYCAPAVIDDFVVRAGLTGDLPVRPLEGVAPITAFAHFRADRTLPDAARALLQSIRQSAAGERSCAR